MWTFRNKLDDGKPADVAGRFNIAVSDKTEPYVITDPCRK